MTGYKHPAPLQNWQDGERGQLPSGQAQTPSPSTIPMQSHHKGMKPLSFPLCEQPSQPSSPTPELLSANPQHPHIWLSWNPAVPEQLITPTEGTEGLPKKPCPPDQVNGWVRMFTQRVGNVHMSSAPLCPDIHTRRSCVCVYGYGMDGSGVSQGRVDHPKQIAPSLPSYPLGLPHLPDAVFSHVRGNLRASSLVRQTKGHGPPAVSECL